MLVGLSVYALLLEVQVDPVNADAVVFVTVVTLLDAVAVALRFAAHVAPPQEPLIAAARLAASVVVLVTWVTQ
jgi:hypothetical protein